MYTKTSIQNLLADITVKKTRKGLYYAIARGVDPETEKVYKQLGTVSSKKVSSMRIQFAINAVITKLEQRYLDFFGREPVTSDDMISAFNKLKDAVLNDNMRLSPKWTSPATNKAAIAYFERNVMDQILPYANSNDRMFLPSDRAQIEATLIAETEARRVDHDGAVEISRRHLVEADIIYQHMREINDRLPELRLSSDEPYVRASKVEQIKFIPLSILGALCSMISGLVESAPKFVFFMVFVLHGLRPAEAAARKPSDIIWFSTYCTAEVKTQERNGKLDTRLKNEYSRRRIVISYWGMSLLKRCCEKIGEDYPQDDEAMNIAVECALRAKQMLIECGMTTNMMERLADSISDDDFDTDDVAKGREDAKKAKIGCYILRRNFATLLRSVMGLSFYETDRLLGHKPSDSKGNTASKMAHVDMNAEETQKSIAMKLERFVFDPAYSLNPSITPYHITAGSELPIHEYSEYIVIADTDDGLELNIEAAETGENIEIIMPLDISQDLKTVSTPKNWVDKHRIVIGDTTWKGAEK